MTIGRLDGTPSANVGLAALALVGTLVAIYTVSQFLRNSIGVIAPDLASELGLSPGEIGLLSSAFFFTFAAVQIPLGMALDRFGPRRCLLACVGLAVVGTVVFAAATSTLGLIVGRSLQGVGAASFLMAPLAIYARQFSPQRFATITGLHIGIGTVGTLLATAPLAFSTVAIGWRGSFMAMAGVTLLIGVLIALFVKDRQPAQVRGTAPRKTSRETWRETWRESLSGIVAVMRTPSVGRLFVMQMVVYSSFALIAGLWGGPYLTHIYGYGLEERGNLLLIPVLAQIVGSFVWGPTDRLTGSYRRPVLLGGVLTAVAFGVLAVGGTLPPMALVAWLAAFGLVSAYVPVLVAHGRALFPLHLVGRGLTVLNIGSMGGVFLSQVVSGFVIGLFPTAPDGGYALAAYGLVFALQAAFILLACLIYSGANDPARELRPKPDPASLAGG
jgi:MFS family permease